MFIALEDVSRLLKIPVVGKAVAVKPLSKPEAIELVSRCLEVSKKEPETAINPQRGMNVKKSWLKSKWGTKPKRTKKVKDKRISTPRVECTTRTYLWYMLGCTLFVDKTSTQVHIQLLQLLENLDEISKYAWGASVLAYLYWRLGSASHVDACYIAGYLTLLEGWVYEHWNVHLAHIYTKYVDALPRACRWILKKEQGLNRSNVERLRRSLDWAQASKVLLLFKPVNSNLD
ncbi:hypothetical protein Scep_029743 [Stephania cephalantha]|uniref:Aminotransferase-like plant mobile domain-containing protein n=1 Tax=Stephania cephalantha TaxID=152367 RepID=A0AAP0E1W5_9MAGN